jgi:murein L,D-transpeptidase YafK
VAQYGAQADARLQPAFQRVGVPYPPAEVALLAFKDTRVMALHARAAADEPWQLVKTYAVLGASGKPGPKLVEGDRQVPEGVYQIELLNPNSRFHLSLRLNYPNAFDRRMTAADGRADLGSDIMIHGGSLSVGCLAMGDEAVEDLFILAARTGKENLRVIIAPTDFRLEPPRLIMYEPRWVSILYAELSDALEPFHRDA